MKITQPLQSFCKAALLFFVFFLSSNVLLADFSLVCPADVTVNCTDDYLHDLNVYGKAYTDYNGVIQYVHDCKTVIELDDCGNGTIKRTWGAENPENWKWFSCTQVITISNANSFRYRDIQWPLSIELISCDPEGDLKILPEPYDAPHWSRTTCAKPMVSYKDTRFAVNPGCIKLLREWKILDWCQYDPINYPGRGLYTYTQVIKLIQSSDSISFQCVKDTLVVNNKNCDSIWVDLPLATLRTGCPIFHSISNDSPFALAKGANASGYYPNGKTKFYYLVEYACGTVSKCEVQVQVVNGIRPTPYCLPGVIVGLMPVDLNRDGLIDEGMAEVWASDLDKASWHSCNGQKLTFSFARDTTQHSRMFTCDDVGENEVEIWITDLNGNQEVCKTKVIISNTNPNIPDCDGNFRGDNNTLIGAQWKELKSTTDQNAQSLVDRVNAKSGLLERMHVENGLVKLMVNGNLVPQGNYTIDCFDLQGKFLLSKKLFLQSQSQTVDLGILPVGMLITRLNGQGISEVKLFGHY